MLYLGSWLVVPRELGTWRVNHGLRCDVTCAHDARRWRL